MGIVRSDHPVFLSWTCWIREYHRNVVLAVLSNSVTIKFLSDDARYLYTEQGAVVWMGWRFSRSISLLPPWQYPAAPRLRPSRLLPPLWGEVTTLTSPALFLGSQSWTWTSLGHTRARWGGLDLVLGPILGNPLNPLWLNHYLFLVQSTGPSFSYPLACPCLIHWAILVLSRIDHPSIDPLDQLTHDTNLSCSYPTAKESEL